MQETSTLVMVTSRSGSDELYLAVGDRPGMERIGDCLAPGTIASCVLDGHRYARAMDDERRAGDSFRRERLDIERP
jgi:dimethylamine/trimethylamine dehydrogenase